MKQEDVRYLLERVSRGETTVGEAIEALARLPFQDLGFARVDHHRALRTGFPEIVFGPGKTSEHIAAIASAIHAQSRTALVTRVDDEKARAVLERLDPMTRVLAHWDEQSGLLLVGPEMEKRGRGRVAVVSAGTSDRPVAEEAARTAEILGNEVVRFNDVGVAGLHRVLAVRPELDASEVVIVVAGMEAALPSVLAGLIARPIVAVPTSIGVGASFGGVAALLGMLNACAPGITVVNIDNGFSAGYAAALINLTRGVDREGA